MHQELCKAAGKLRLGGRPWLRQFLARSTEDAEMEVRHRVRPLFLDVQ